MKKKLGLLMAVVMIASVLSACSPTENAETTETPTAGVTGNAEAADADTADEGTGEEEPLKIAIVYSIVHEFFDQVTKGAEEEVANSGKDIELIIKAPDNGDVGKQMEIVENLISMGVDAIAIGPSDSAALTPLIDKAIDAGIKVICFDTDAPDSKRIAYVGTDNYAAGRVLGEEVGKLNPKAKVICTIAVPTQLGLQQRLQGAKDVFAESYPDIELLDVQSSGGDPAKTLSNIEDMAKTYPDFDILIGIDAQAGPAAVTAWKSLGITGEKSVVTFDDLPAVIQGVRDGQINVAISQNEFLWGKEIVTTLSDLCAGKEITNIDPIEAIVVTKDNVDELYK